MSGGVLRPVSSSFSPLSVILNPFCGPGSSVSSDSTKPVALEPLQGGVDLTHVEGPDLAGAHLEFLSKLQAVFRSLAQQGEQRVTNAHDVGARC